MEPSALTHVATHVDEHRLREQIVAFGKSLFDRGLTAGSSGNLSARLDDGWLVTPTNASLGSLDPARLSKLDWQGRVLSGDAPSKEAVLHRAVYEERAAAAAIVHLHATHSAAVSCMSGLDADDCIPPLTAYFVMKIGMLPLVPYFRPGDPALANAIRGLAAKHTAVLLANHGPVVSGRSLEAAVHAIEELEETAKLFLLLRGSPTRPLNEAQVAEIRSVFEADARMPGPSI
jgi:ribulose-5-phosphate 4-epimerase/fuculose-1-phosphate aldolase